MFPNNSAFVPCENCGGSTLFATQTSPLGDEPGYRIYHCPVCNRLTWTEWQMHHAQPQEAEARPILQQQQPQQKKETDGGTKT